MSLTGRRQRDQKQTVAGLIPFQPLLLILLLPLSSRLCHADTPAFHASGRVYSDIYAPLIDLGTNPFPYVAASAWLQGDARFGETTSARAILEADAFDAASPGIGGPGYGAADDTLHASLREGWVDYSRAGFGFRLGRQIIPWGKSDAINPTDFLSAKDYTIFNPDDEIRRIGATSLESTFTPDQGVSPVTLTLVWTAVAPESRLLLPPSAVPSQVTLSSTPLAPAATLSNSELAFKTAYQGQGWDASLLAFRGYNHLPELTQAGPTTIAPAFHPIHAAGGDASFTEGQWIFRAESAYVWTLNNDGTDPEIQPSHWDTVLGVERPIGNSFRLQGQFYWRYFPNFEPPATATGSTPPETAYAQGIAEANALLLNDQNKSLTSGTFRAAYSEDSVPWEAEFFTVVNFVGGDYLLRPKAVYAWSDALKTSLGVEYYGGPRDRPLGALHDYSSVFVEGKALF